MRLAGTPPAGAVHVQFRDLVAAGRIQAVHAEDMGADGTVLILGAVGEHHRTALILRHIHKRVVITFIR